MTEQVIDIRDRIEKMRTQMTSSSDPSNNLKKQRVENKNPPKNSIKIEKMENVEIVKTANEEKTQIPKNEISEEKILDIAIDAGAEECHSDNEIHEIHCEKNKIYEVKKKLEMTVKNFISTEIEWIPINNVIISKDIFDEISDFLDSLDNDDDVQNIFTNLKIGSN